MKNFILFRNRSDTASKSTTVLTDAIHFKAESHGEAVLIANAAIKNDDDILALFVEAGKDDDGQTAYRLIPARPVSIDDILAGCTDIAKHAGHLRSAAEDIKAICAGNAGFNGLDKHCDDVIELAKRVLSFAEQTANFAFDSEDHRG